MIVAQPRCFSVGEHKYEYWRLEKRIAYARFFYTKQMFLLRLSTDAPDVVNAFSVMAKLDTSHGFPVHRPMERNSDWAIYNLNGEGWFQCFAFLAAVGVSGYWVYSQGYFLLTGFNNIDDEDMLRLKDAKTGQKWERVAWAITYAVHAQHFAALQRSIKAYKLHPDDPKLSVQSSYNSKNPYAPDRYYQGWGKQTDMRILHA